MRQRLKAEVYAGPWLGSHVLHDPHHPLRGGRVGGMLVPASVRLGQHVVFYRTSRDSGGEGTRSAPSPSRGEEHWSFGGSPGPTNLHDLEEEHGRRLLHHASCSLHQQCKQRPPSNESLPIVRVPGVSCLISWMWVGSAVVYSKEGATIWMERETLQAHSLHPTTVAGEVAERTDGVLTPRKV